MALGQGRRALQLADPPFPIVEACHKPVAARHRPAGGATCRFDAFRIKLLRFSLQNSMLPRHLSKDLVDTNGKTAYQGMHVESGKCRATTLGRNAKMCSG